MRAWWMAAALALGGAAPPPVIEPGPPVMTADFPDPFLIAADGGYRAYATNAPRRGINVQMATSPDLATWTLSDADAMPVMPRWARRGWTWAPEVLRVGAAFRLYFTARERRGGRQCVGVASATTAAGPFVDAGDAPLVCQRALGGTIDASPFADADGRLFLYFKNDGNAVRRPTRIWGQAMTADGLALTGEPVALAANDAPWEGHVVEAPTMVRGAGYRLFFSANDYGWPDRWRLSPYAIGYADCAGPLGPCRDAPGNPILASRSEGGDCRSGPGHQSVLATPAGTVFTYHTWVAGRGCGRGVERRVMHVGRLR